jgi:VanZ family protein
MKLRLLSVLCVVYVFLILYASLMPFDLDFTRLDTDRRLDAALHSWPIDPTARVSHSDVLSNFLLYIPLSGLLAARIRLGRRRRGWISLIPATIAAIGVSLSVELLQLFSNERTSSALDFFLNTIGGATGAFLGCALGRWAWVRLVRWLRVRWRSRPASVAATALLLVLAADALFPFRPTLATSFVWRNLKRSHLDPVAGFAAHPWHYWVVVKVGAWAMLAILLSASRRTSRYRWLLGGALVACFALALELLKPFVIMRSANIVNVLSAWSGCAAGALLGAAFVGRLCTRVRTVLAATALTVFVVYLEWEPFTFVWSVAAMGRKVPTGAELLPLYHYAMGARAEDVRLFVRSAALLAALVCTLRLGGWLRGATRLRRALSAALAAGALGLLLELGQFALPRVPSVTDVLCFALGGALGGWLALPPVLRTRVGELASGELADDSRPEQAGEPDR